MHIIKHSGLGEFELRGGLLRLTTNCRGLGLPRRFYSTKATIPVYSRNKENYIDPWFVTGFSDAEGCFMVTIRENPGINLG